MWTTGSIFGGARRVEPELLDRLPPHDPRAIGSRRDLRRVNAVMRNSRIMARALTTHWQGETPRVLLDLGCGDGTFLLDVARRVAPAWREVSALLLDRVDIVSDEVREGFAALGWRAQSVSADALAFLDRDDDMNVDVVVANLFLHHLPAAALTRLFGHAAQRARLVVACEPRRDPIALLASRALWVLGCNEVSRHDAVASVRAGFNRRELSELWPSGARWVLTEEPAMLFTHCFVARRTEAAP